jgi:integrase
MSITINYFLANKSKFKTAKELSICGVVQYTFDDANGTQKRRFKFSTGQKSPVKGFKNGKVVGSVINASHINSKLAEFRKNAEKLYNHYTEKKKFPTPQAFKDKIFKGVIEVEEERDFVKDFEDYIKLKGSPQKSIVKNLNQALNRIKAMKKKTNYSLDYSTINMEFYLKFKKFCDEVVLTDERVGISKNTFGGHIKLLKTFLNYAKSNGWNRYEYYTSKDFKILTEEIKVVSLTEDEVNKVAELNLSNRPRLGLTRDYFLLGCETGLRYIDYAKINKSSIKEVKNGYNLEIKTQKTDANTVIPLSQLAMDILAKYSYQLPEPPTNQKLNKNLKTVMELAKVDKSISSHDSRRTFCTLQYHSGTPVAWLMAISTHRTERQFYAYIGVDLKENADKVRDMHDKYKIEKKGLLNNKLKVA